MKVFQFSEPDYGGTRDHLIGYGFGNDEKDAKEEFCQRTGYRSPWPNNYVESREIDLKKYSKERVEEHENLKKQALIMEKELKKFFKLTFSDKLPS